MAEFTGERVIPGQVNADLLNEHFARYAFAARLCSGKNVLDAGCGAGYGSAELARDASAVLGIDRSLEAIEFAGSHYALPNLRFKQADCSALPVPDASIDLAVAFEVIEHLEDWPGFLLESRRALSPAGQLLVSTPNRLYYAESRRSAGPNPFHVHEFEFDEFRAALNDVFPYVTLFLENHTEGVVFQPAASTAAGSDVRVDRTRFEPAESHFFLAVCGLEPHAEIPAFVYVPRVANLLREREQHIELLASELGAKNSWLEKSTSDLAELNRDHQTVLEMFREQMADLEQRAAWAENLKRQVGERDARIEELQLELSAQQDAGLAMANGYEAQIRLLEEENAATTGRALETEARLGREIAERCEELARCLDLLHDAEATIETRTAWALNLESRANEFERELSLMKGSRWVKLGRQLGLGPMIPMDQRKS